MLNITPAPSAIYRLITGQAIPYWLYLRILHLLSVCPFGPGESTSAFVISGLRGDGIDVSEVETMIIVLTNELMLMDTQERNLIKALEEHQMKPKYSQIIWSALSHQIEAITPRLTVSLSDLTMDPKPVSFGLQMETSRDDTYPTATQRAALHLSSPMRDLPSATEPGPDAYMNDNFDLSCTSFPITGDNYQDFMHSPPSTPIKPLDMTADPDNLPRWMWPRAPHLGQPHIDAFTGLRMRTIHKSIFDPTAGFNGWEEDESEMPLLGEFTIDEDYENPPSRSRTADTYKLMDKASSTVSALKDAFTEDTEHPPFSRWSPERLSFMQLDSSSDNLSESSSPGTSSLDSTASSGSESLSSRTRDAGKSEPLKTAASDVAFTRLRPSRSNDFLGRVRRLVPNKISKVDLKDKSPLPGSNAKADTVADITDKFEDSELQPTTDNLLRLLKAGHGLPEIKEMCGFEESVDDLQVM